MTTEQPTSKQPDALAQVSTADEVEKIETLPNSAASSTTTSRDGSPSRAQDHSRESRSKKPASLSGTISEVRDGIENRRDLERGVTEEEEKTIQASLSGEHDPNLVGWDGPDDPENPKKWPLKKRWLVVVCVSSFTFISPVSSSMVAPALSAIGADLSIEDPLEQNLVMSIFVLAYAIGPLIIGPLSELYGRVVVLQITNLIYLVFNLGCGLAQNKAQMVVFRFLSGLGGSAPQAIGGGVLGDLFVAEERGRAMSVYSLMPLLGPAIGPLAGGFIAQETSWRWIFHATTIVDAVIQVVGLLFLRETYPPVLLERKRRRLVKETGNEALHTEYETSSARTSLRSRLGTALTRPFILLATQPIVQVLALYMMYIYGTVYLVLASFPVLFTNVYHQSTGIGGLNYISLGVGFYLGAQICAPLQDRIYVALKRRHHIAPNEPGRPEFRVPIMLPGALLIPLGLFIYAWTAQVKAHWIWPNIGAALFSTGAIIGFQCIQGYLVDTYTRYAASAVAAATVMRSLSGFGFPLFAPALYARLDYGYGGTVLAIIAVVIGWPSPILLWKYGEKLRKKSPFAAGG